MANLNLSQFGEKLFVADADHTFIWDSAASISKRVSRNSWLNSGTLTSDAPVTISQTWNAVGQTFKALVVNAAGTSDANSASGSLLADFQLGGVSKASVSKGGQLTVTAGLATAEGGIAYGSEFFLRSVITNDSVGVVRSGTVRASMGTSGFQTCANGILGFSDNITNNATIDTVLRRDGAANTLALRNGAAAQTFRVYKSYLNAGVDYERLSFSHDGVQFGIGTERAGSGIAQPLRFFGGSSAALDFANGVSFRNASGETTFMTVASSGNVGIGTTSPTSKLQVSAGDVEVDTIAKGVILKSPDGTRYRVTVANGGTLSVAAV